MGSYQAKPTGLGLLPAKLLGTLAERGLLIADLLSIAFAKNTTMLEQPKPLMVWLHTTKSRDFHRRQRLSASYLCVSNGLSSRASRTWG